MNIHLTKKLQKKLHLTSLGDSPVATSDFSCWYANVFTSYSRHYIITTHANSLFTIVQFGGGITSPEKYVNQFEDALIAYLADLGLAELYAQAVAKESPLKASVYNTSNKSVLGVMNGIVSHCRGILQGADYDPRILTDRVNSMPWQFLDFRIPVKAFSNLLGVDLTSLPHNRGLSLV